MSRYVEVVPGVMAYREAWKPHMRRREGETAEQHNHRVFHSCYRCGHYEDDEAILDAHEDTCTGAPPKTEEQS